MRYRIVPDDGDGPSGVPQGSGDALLAFCLICAAIVGALKVFGVL